jgi:hypothetical protein
MLTRRSTIAGFAGSALAGSQARAEGKPLVIVTSYAG